MIPEVAKLKDKKLHLVILEPYEIATPIGESGLDAVVQRFVVDDKEALVADISVSPPLAIGGTRYSRLLAAPRHVGNEWASLLAERSLTVQLGTGEVLKATSGGINRARLGKLLAVGHLRIP